MSPCPADSSPYIVQPGDTFYRLATKFKTTVDAIVRLNPGVDPNRLVVGQIICVPGQPYPGCPPETFGYMIQAGDTLYSIASSNYTTVGVLIALNPGVDPNNLRVGQVICVPEVQYPMPPGRPCLTGLVPYTVKPGDTIFGIAKARGVPMSLILRYNPGIDPYNLQVGQVLCVP